MSITYEYEYIEYLTFSYSHSHNIIDSIDGIEV